MKKKRTFTIWHGLAASIAVHAAAGLPFIVSVIAAPPGEPPLLIELQGVAPDSLDLAEVKQSEIDQKRGAPEQPRPDRPDPAKEHSLRQTEAADEPPMEVAADDKAEHNLPQPTPTPPTRTVQAPPPVPETKAAPDDNDVNAAREYVPPTRKVDQPEMTEQEYGNLVFKKVRDSRVVPDEVKRGRMQGTATVSFVIQSNGDIRPETLKVVKSSGQPTLDAGALNTIRASAPFAPPPREISVSIGVAFGPKR